MEGECEEMKREINECRDKKKKYFVGLREKRGEGNDGKIKKRRRGLNLCRLKMKKKLRRKKGEEVE